MSHKVLLWYKKNNCAVLCRNDFQSNFICRCDTPSNSHLKICTLHVSAILEC